MYRLLRQRFLLVSHRLVRPSDNLPLGHGCQRYLARSAWYLRFYHSNPSDQLRPSRAGDLDLNRLRRGMYSKPKYCADSPSIKRTRTRRKRTTTNASQAMGPISYSIIAEASSVRLRALSTGVGRGA